MVSWTRDDVLRLALRRATYVLLLCLVLSTHVLAQPDLLEVWSLGRVAVGWGYYFAEITLAAFVMLGGYTLAERVTAANGSRRPMAVAVALPLSAMLGSAIALKLLYSPQFPLLSVQFASDSLRMTAIGCTVALIDILRARRDRDAKAALEVEVARQAMAKQTLEAQLQLLEAQIEPHFLFNSLANVQRLYESQPESAERLLDNLKVYLRAALPRMREAHSTIGREADLARAYLEVIRARMGERLRFEVDVSEGLRAHVFPPMMLITLVENAVKHGIHCSREGGTIHIRAARDSERVAIEVVDTGVGFQRTSGTGVGLANIRARLIALFGDRARLFLCANEPSGVVATIEVPA